MEFNGTFFVAIITFILFVFVMNKILYAPILGIMKKRHDFVNENYRITEENNLKTKSLVTKKEETLTVARNNARTQYLKKIDDFKERKAEIILNAQSSAREKLENSKMELENISNEVKSALKSKMIDLAGEISEKVLGYRPSIVEFDNESIDKILYK